ncbi:MAG: hypothetical protein AB1938_00140 [Myxococcota bacterium]
MPQPTQPRSSADDSATAITFAPCGPLMKLPARLRKPFIRSDSSSAAPKAACTIHAHARMRGISRSTYGTLTPWRSAP